MVDQFEVQVVGLRGQKQIEVLGDTGSIPWALGLERTDDDAEAFQEVLGDLADRVAEEVAAEGRGLDSIPSGTTVGVLQANNVGAFDFTPDLEDPQFGDLKAQTGGQTTFGDTDDDPQAATRRETERAISNQAAQDRAAERDREQMDLMTAGATDRFDVPDDSDDRDPSDPGRGEARSGSEALGGQSGLDEFAADRQAASEAVQAKGIDGENMERESVREAAADTPGPGIPDDAGDPDGGDPFERVVFADDRGRGRDAVMLREIGIDDSVIDALVSVMEDEFDVRLESFDDGVTLGRARFSDAGDRLIGFERADDLDVGGDAATGGGGVDTPDTPDPEDPPTGWRYAPKNRGNQTVDVWESAVEFRETPVARARIQDAGGEPSITILTLDPEAMIRRRTVYNSNPQKLSRDVRRSIMRPVESREQALFRAFDAMRDFDAEQYREQAFGDEIDVLRIDGVGQLSVGDVVEIPYESSRGAGSDSIAGRIVSFNLPDARGIELTQDRVWDATRSEVRVDGTKVGNTDHGGSAISIVEADDDDTGGGGGMDAQLGELVDRVSEVVDGYGDRVSADATVSRAFSDAGLDASKWTERQSQDVFRFGIATEDILSRWREEFESDPDTDPDDIGPYVETLVDVLPEIIDDDNAGDGDQTGDDAGDGPPDVGPDAGAMGGVALAEASRPLDLEPVEYPEPGEFSLRTVESDVVAWSRSRNTMPQRLGITEGGGVKQVNVAGREIVEVRTLSDTGWQVRRRTEVFRDGSFETLGAATTVAEVAMDSFGAAVEMALETMESRSGGAIATLPRGTDFEPEEATFDEFGGDR